MTRHISTPPTQRIVGFPQARFRFHDDICVSCHRATGEHKWHAVKRELHCEHCDCGGCS